MHFIFAQKKNNLVKALGFVQNSEFMHKDRRAIHMVRFIMAQLTDPTPAMVSFQQAIKQGEITPQKASLKHDVFVYRDKLPSGEMRFAYAQMNGQTVLAFANFITNGLEDQLPVFQVGVAVPEIERCKGRGKHIVSAGIAELKHGLSRNYPNAAFYVEAVVGLENIASQHIMASVLSLENTEQIIDSVSGEPALHFIKKF